MSAVEIRQNMVAIVSERPWGMSFVLLLVPAAAAAALYLRAPRIAVVTGAAMLIVLGFGILRLNPPEPHTVGVGLHAAVGLLAWVIAPTVVCAAAWPRPVTE